MGTHHPQLKVFYDALEEGERLAKKEAKKTATSVTLEEILLDPGRYKTLQGAEKKRIGDFLELLRSRQRAMARMSGPAYFRVARTFTIGCFERHVHDRCVAYSTSQVIKYEAGRHLTLWPTELPIDEEFRDLFLHAWADPDGWIMTDAELVFALRKMNLMLREKET